MRGRPFPTALGNFWATFALTGGGGEGMPPDPSNKERLRRSIVNRASNTTLGTPLRKKAGYAPGVVCVISIVAVVCVVAVVALVSVLA